MPLSPRRLALALIVLFAVACSSTAAVRIDPPRPSTTTTVGSLPPMLHPTSTTIDPNVETVNKATVLIAEAAQQSTSTTPATIVLGPATSLSHPQIGSTSTCGGDLPPCYVCQRESHCTYGIVSRTINCAPYVCYGKWQFNPRTYTTAARAVGAPTLFDASPKDPFAVYRPDRWAQVTPADEDAAARWVWAGGAGCNAWAAC